MGEVALSDEFVIGRTQDVFSDKIYDVTSRVQETMTQMGQAPDKAQKAIDKLKEDGKTECSQGCCGYCAVYLWL